MTGISAGTYNYSFTNVTGYNIPGSSSISVNSNENVNAAFSSSTPTGISPTYTYAATGAAAVVGILAGLGIAMFLRKKP